MHKGRLEAFSDGVLAIIITIMVLEIKVPHGDTLAHLQSLLPVFLSYLLSFIYVGIYWNNYHHMLQAAHKVSGAVLWANLHLLFWLSLLPFASGWMGENHFTPVPTLLYGVVLLMSACAYWLLTRTLIVASGPDSALARATGRDVKGKLSIVLYAIALPFSFYYPLASQLLYAAVAMLWLLPDRRIEHVMQQDQHQTQKENR